jgi:hypothetical protein
MRLLTIGVSLIVLGVSGVPAARAGDGARFAGIGTGISHAPGDQPSTFVSPTPAAGGERSARATKPAERTSPAPAAARRADPGNFTYRGLRMNPTGLDPAVYGAVLGRGDKGTAAGGATLLPPDLEAMPKPPGRSGSDRPSPTFSVRENGGVLGLSYKIKPTQP